MQSSELPTHALDTDSRQVLGQYLEDDCAEIRLSGNDLFGQLVNWQRYGITVCVEPKTLKLPATS
jgi:hypothetical protein